MQEVRERLIAVWVSLRSVAVYRIEIGARSSRRTVYAEVDHVPREGESLTVGQANFVVTDFVHVTPVYREARGHNGIVVCRFEGE
jgi:hypothetical protein